MAVWARLQGARRLEASVRDDDPDSLRWAIRRGYVNDGHVFRSRLDLTLKEGAPHAWTYNHSANGPVAAINEKLGYRKLTGRHQLSVTL